MHRREAGVTLIGGILILIVAGVLVLAAVRIVPLYFEAAKIGSAMDALRANAQTNPIHDLRAELSEQLVVNSIDNVPINQFRFSFHDDQLTISLDRDLKTPYIGNLGFAVHYRHAITVPREGNE